MMTPEREKLLIEGALKGNESDFETLILSCSDRAYSLAYRYLNNHDDAMDAVQESFIKIYRYLRNFKGDSSFQTWVYRIVANTCKDFFRKKKSRINPESLFKGFGDDEYELNIADEGKGPLDTLLEKEDSKAILEALNELPEDQKEILTLRDIEDFSYEEISEILSLSLGTVKSRISRARLKLKEVYLKQRSD